jgi:two-component system OmpR family sensor kinase
VHVTESRLTLRNRILVAFVGVASITLVVSLVSINLVHQSLVNQVGSVLASDTQAILATHQSAPTSVLTEQLQALAASVGVVSIHLPGTKEPQVSGQKAGEALLKANPALSPGMHTIGSWEFYTTSSPSGVSITVGQNLSTYAATAGGLTLEELIATSVYLALLVILSIWVLANAVRPLRALTDVTEAVEKGDLSRRVDVGADLRGTEFDVLATSFNAMLETMELRRQRDVEVGDELRRFVSDAGHELRTPLTVITGYIQLLRWQGTTEEQKSDALDRVESESARMMRVVEDLLALTRLEGPLALRYERVNLSTLLNALTEDHRAIDHSRPVSVTAPTTVTMDVDVDTLTRFVVNLLSNLRAHTPEGTSATIELIASATGCEIAYNDTGPGVATPGRLFDRFWQANSNRDRALSGVGLGMAIAAAAIKAHGGTISASSSPSGGLCVRAYLPGPTTLRALS